jgi:mannan endo-1,4-beta-mannosidase
MKHITVLIALLLSLAAFAGQVCTIDPPRPAGNTGAGLYTVGAKLYDLQGEPVLIQGMNRAHWNNYGTTADYVRTGANSVRLGGLGSYFARKAADNLADLKTFTDAGIIPIVSTWTTTCKSDAASLTAAVDTWVAQAATFQAINATGILNIANEWGPAAQIDGNAANGYAKIPVYTWRDQNISAVQRLRTAGYTMPLMIDAPSCGQDATAVWRDGAAIVAADPQHNVIFDVHVYGLWHQPATAAYMQDYDKAMGKLAASGLPIIIGEFGPGKNIGPSPTLITPDTIIATAKANGWGWMPWAWDDNNLTGCAANDASYSMTTKCGVYTGLPSDLTLFGQALLPYMQTAKRAALR